MNYIPKSYSICILVLLALVFSPTETVAQQGKWRIKNRFQAGYEYDNNIRENPSDSLSDLGDSSLRLLFQSRAIRSQPKNQFKLSYQGGLQSYFQHSIENKLINELQAAAVFKRKHYAIGILARGRLKIYLNDVLDYSTGSTEMFVRLPMFLSFSPKFSVGISGLHYQNFSQFDYSEKYFSWSFLKKITKRLTAVIFASGNVLNFHRTALIFDPGNANLIFDRTDQQDKQFNTRLQFNYTKHFLLNMSYLFQYNSSNSFGYTYSRHQFILVFGLPLPQRIWIRGYGAVQIKNYRDENIPIFPLDVDTERQESNFFILDVSKDFNPNVTLLTRVAVYNNESVIRNRFYKKTLLTLGFDYRF